MGLLIENFTNLHLQAKFLAIPMLAIEISSIKNYARGEIFQSNVWWISALELVYVAIHSFRRWQTKSGQGSRKPEQQQQQQQQHQNFSDKTGNCPNFKCTAFR